MRGGRRTRKMRGWKTKRCICLFSSTSFLLCFHPSFLALFILHCPPLSSNFLLFHFSSSALLSIPFLLLLSHNLRPFISLPPSFPLLFDSFFKGLPNSCVLPQRLFVCTSIISGDKRRPFHRSHANLKPDTLTFLFLLIFAFFVCGESSRFDR